MHTGTNWQLRGRRRGRRRGRGQWRGWFSACVVVIVAIFGMHALYALLEQDIAQLGSAPPQAAAALTAAARQTPQRSEEAAERAAATPPDAKQTEAADTHASAPPALRRTETERVAATQSAWKQTEAAERSAATTPSATKRDDYLVLVNSDNPISDDAPDFNIVSAYRVVPLLTSAITLEETTLDAVAALFRAAKNAGIDNLLVNDGFRSSETQRQIYDEAADKSLVQPPGCSEHETGLAVDIAANGVLGSDMGESAEGRWLAEHAWEYGFILRYPQGKQGLTGIAYEPWHFRYVGAEHAKSIYESGLCMEEYLDVGN